MENFKMEVKYEVKDNKILAISVVTSFDEIINYLSTDRESGYRDVKSLVVTKVADAITTEFLSKHTLDVLNLLDPRAVANAVALQAIGELRNGGR